jgi:hypothetical protein
VSQDSGGRSNHFNLRVQLYMIPAIRKSDYVENESPKASPNEQENPLEVVVQAGIRGERNCEAAATSGENRPADLVVCRLVEKSKGRELRGFPACVSSAMIGTILLEPYNGNYNRFYLWNQKH